MSRCRRLHLGEPVNIENTPDLSVERHTTSEHPKCDCEGCDRPATHMDFPKYFNADGTQHPKRNHCTEHAHRLAFLGLGDPNEPLWCLECGGRVR